MRPFNFFRRNSSRTLPDEPDLDALEDAQRDKARCHHYGFAHAVLPAFARQAPMRCLAALASPDARAFLQAVLDSVTEYCKDDELAPDFTVDDLRVHQLRVGNFPCAVVQMPPPRGTTEAHFVALVVLHDLDRLEDAAPSESPDPIRYITLEKGFSLDGTDRTVLGEWDENGHCNYGDGPPPDLTAFIGAVERMIISASRKWKGKRGP